MIRSTIARTRTLKPKRSRKCANLAQKFYAPNCCAVIFQSGRVCIDPSFGAGDRLLRRVVGSWENEIIAFPLLMHFRAIFFRGIRVHSNDSERSVKHTSVCRSASCDDQMALIAMSGDFFHDFSLNYQNGIVA